jgi:hypothetical protein
MKWTSPFVESIFRALSLLMAPTLLMLDALVV